MSNARQIREEITAKIVAALEKDLLPWRRPWASNNAGQHSNALTKKSYKGVNPLLLATPRRRTSGLSQIGGPHSTNGNLLGCSINRRPDHVEGGQWGCGLAVYIPIKREVEDGVTMPRGEEEDVFWVLKKFIVFNADQVNGANAEKFQAVGPSRDCPP